jgi:acyl phosphate:glycerol-3-phosphate acyltransferase
VQAWASVGAVVASFLLGSVNPAMILARLLGVDLRRAGSGNPGATNAGRVLGLRWGIVVGVADVLKGFLPVFVVMRTLGTTLALVVGLAVVLGHIWSPFLHGAGGKGVATSFGALLAVEPWFALGLAVLFALLYWRLRWMAGTSLVVLGVLLLLGLAAWAGWIPGATRDEGAWCVVLALIVGFRHRGNVERWLAERRE